LTGVYTVFGGFRAVLFTDAAQALILLIGSALITVIGLIKLGGWNELQSFASSNVADFALWRPMGDPDFPWLGILMASPIIGGLLAALMSSLSSLFNSSASLFTHDVYQKLYPDTSSKQMVLVGRSATVVVVVLGMLWIPVMAEFSEKVGLYKYLQSVQGYLAPPITAVFLLGLFYARTNSAGAVAGLVLGFAAGMTKLGIEILYNTKSNLVMGNSVLEAIGAFNFLYASGVLFGFAVAAVFIVSNITASPRQEQVKGLTFAQMDREAVRASWGWPEVIATVVVLGATAGFYVYFSFWI